MTEKRTVPITALEGEAVSPRPVKIVVLEGPDAGRSVRVEGGTALLGSQPGSLLELTDATVSRRHAQLELLGSRVRIKDLGSTNGTWLLEARVDQAVLPLGSTVRLGKTRLAFLAADRDEAPLSDRRELGGLLGGSLAMRRLYAEIERVGPSDVAVLVQGETGSGKEAVARALHALSARAKGPFVVFDGAAVQPELAASALFGHLRGSFTGASRDVAGALERAHHGTLFIDEVGELPAAVQPVLLRALDQGTFQRLGDTAERSADFRLITATHRDLAAEGTLRRDLFHRLAALTLRVPPLRERLDDIPTLAAHFSEALSELRGGGPIPLSPAGVAALTAYGWPGNVRELRNVIERAVALGQQPSPTEAATGSEPDGYYEARDAAMKAFELGYLEMLLAKHGGNVSAAAKAARVARSYFYRLLGSHGLAKR